MMKRKYNFKNNGAASCHMFNLDKFISDSVTFRPVSVFAADIEAKKGDMMTTVRMKLL